MGSRRHRESPPQVLHHTLEPEGERHYVKRYLAGPYLLDPLYELALREEKPAMCRFRDATPDRFHSSEYYRQYCERTHLRDEMDFLVDVGEGSTLALVVARREKMFAKTELARLQQVARDRGNTFEAMMDAARFCSLGSLSHALYDVGGEYRRNM